MSIPLSLTGGLDLFSPTLKAAPGSLTECLNYEVATRNGYTRINGVERFDGGPSVGALRIVTFTAPTVSGRFVVGEAATYAGATGYVIEVVAKAGQPSRITVAMPSGGYDLSAGQLLEAAGSGSSAAASGVRVSFEPTGKQVDLQAAIKNLAATRRAQVLPVPGRDGADVLGTFMLRSAVYAVRDLPRQYFTGGYYLLSDEGRHIAIGGEQFKVLDVRVTAEKTGYIVFDPTPVPGVVPMMRTIGTPELTSLPVTGALDDGLRTIPYSSGLTVGGGLPPFTWTLLDADTQVDPPKDVSDLSGVRFLSEQTPAALWRALDEGGWERVNTGRELSFKQGAGTLKNFNRSLSLDPTDVRDSGWIMPTSATVNGTPAPQLLVNDAIVASLGTADGGTALVSGFSFNIPAGAQLLGIEVEVVRRCGAVGRARDLFVTISGVAGQPDNKAAGLLPNTLTAQTYGSSTDLWGCENLGPEDVDTGAMTVVIGFEHDESKGVAPVEVATIRARAFYAIRSGLPLYLWNGVSDVAIVANHIQLQAGDPTISTGEGTINCSAPANADKPRMIAAGDQIRTAPGGGGDQVGVAASTDRPVFLPGQLEVDHNRSAYQFRVANFFAQDKYAAVYGVSGAGPAFAFDGETIIKIRTGLNPQDDIPRHVAKHGSSLVLGYFGGAQLLSVPGEPMNMRGEDGAVAIETGDRLSALVELPGDALGVIGVGGSGLLRGMSALSFQKTTLSARRGAIEYTSGDMGRAIIADSFGLFFTEAAESYGSAARDYISVAIQPLLRDRLQATVNSEQRFLRPVAALAVRAKSQYRLFFRDGWIVTGSMRADGTVEFTTQRYFTPGEGEGGVPMGWAVRSVTSGIDASGRERLFATFNGTKAGYVFELDTGNTLDGAPIPFHIELNPLSVTDDQMLAKLGQQFLYGAGCGYATIKMQRASSFESPAGTDAMEVLLGRREAPATLREGEIKASIDFPLEGYEFGIRFSGETDTEAAHTLQLIHSTIDGRGNSRGDRG